MRYDGYRCVVASCLVTLSRATAFAATIVVDVGTHADARSAAYAEAQVDWLNADTADDAVCTEAFAAVELQRCLRHMTQRAGDFAIVDDDALPRGDLIVVGRACLRHRLVDAASSGQRRRPDQANELTLSKADREAYRVKTVDREGRRVVVVLGATRVGTLYAAYDFLHLLGCRWFAPGELHEVIPRLALDALPAVDASQRPAFRTRGFHAWENRGDKEFLLWMARNRLNYWCVEQQPHALMHKLGIQMSCGGHVAQSMFLNPARPYPYNHPRFRGDEGKPVDPYPVGEQYQGDTSKDGKLTYFEAHPEWFAEVKGERIPGIRGEGGTNYCTSNDDATAEFMKNFVECLSTGKWKGAGVVRFWTLDAGKWCQCAQCKALGIPTDRNLLLVHRLDQEIKKARVAGKINRPIIIRFLAYADVLQPPTQPLPEHFDYNACSATYFPIVRCYVHTIDDPRCARNAHYLRQLQGWAVDPKRHYRGQLCIGEYYNVSGYKCLPVCFMHTMANDIPFYHKVGARHFHYMHVTTDNWGNKALTNYQMARQLWDVRTDCEALWEDYFARRYVPAAGTMRKFYESLEKMLCNVSRLKYGLARRLNGGAENLFPDSHLRYRRERGVPCDGVPLVGIVGHAKTCRQLIDQALEKVSGASSRSPEGASRKEHQAVISRISEDERLFTYGERTVLYYDACAQAFVLARSGKRDEARERFAEAERLADLLRNDTTSTTMSSSHANARNAFIASRATGALTHLAERLGPPMAKIKPFDPRKQPLVLTGRDFSGGGAVRYGHGLHVYPGRKKVSEDGNVVYAKPNGAFSRMTAWFRLDGRPKRPLKLIWVGLCRPVKDDDTIPAEVLVNGKSIYRGDAPFSIQGLSSHEISVPADAVVKGENKLTVRNLAPSGPVGNRPWFGVDRVELSASKAF